MDSPAGEMTGDAFSAGAPPLPPFVRPHTAPAPARDAALGAVAERLERIAAALRRGSPEELLARLESAEGADPLDLLITGYALGYAQASRRAGSDLDRGEPA